MVTPKGKGATGKAGVRQERPRIFDPGSSLSFSGMRFDTYVNFRPQLPRARESWAHARQDAHTCEHPSTAANRLHSLHLRFDTYVLSLYLKIRMLNCDCVGASAQPATFAGARKKARARLQPRRAGCSEFSRF